MGTIDLTSIFGQEPHCQAVYFARVGELIKIGTTTRVRARLAQLRCGLGDLLWIEPGSRASEDYYHGQFRDCQEPQGTQREFFRLEGDLEEFLRGKTPPRLRPVTPSTDYLTRRRDLHLVAEGRDRAATGLGKRMRKRAHITQAELAGKAGVSRAAVAAWEAGTRLPKAGNAVAYARALRAVASWTTR